MTNVIESVIQRGWNTLKRVGLIQTVTIVRYVETDTGHPEVGVEPTRERLSGMDDVEAFVVPLSSKQALESQGKFAVTDRLFVFYGFEIIATDDIEYGGKTYVIDQVKYADPTLDLYEVIGRAI